MSTRLGELFMIGSNLLLPEKLLVIHMFDYALEVCVI